LWGADTAICLVLAVLMSAMLIAFVLVSPPPDEADPLKGEMFHSFLQSASADEIREICQGGNVDMNQLDTFGNPPSIRSCSIAFWPARKSRIPIR
jgi:hypothetical protein